MFGLLRRMPGYQLLLMVLVPAGVAAAAMMSLRPRGVDARLDPFERYVIEEATAAAARTMASALAPMRTVLLMPLHGDGDGSATAELRARLTADGFEVVDQRDLSTLEALAREVEAFLSRLAGSANWQGEGAAPAAEAARKAKAQAALFGKVLERRTADGRTSFGVALRAVRAENGETVLAQAFDAQVRRSWTSGAYRTVWIQSRAWWARLGVWLAAAGLLPVAAAPLARRVLARESNAANAALLGGLTLLDAAAAWLLLGAAGGTAAVILVVLGALAAGAYNFVICDRLAQATG
jgi:hypothetical protein